MARTYWNAQAYNDALIGAIRERLRRLGVLDDTLIVVTADHGESLFDDGFLGHGHALNEQQTRIPFVLSDAGVPMPAALGLDDMRAIVLGAARRGAAARHGPVFQYLGTLDRPGQIGWVGADGAPAAVQSERGAGLVERQPALDALCGPAAGGRGAAHRRRAHPGMGAPALAPPPRRRRSGLVGLRSAD